MLVKNVHSYTQKKLTMLLAYGANAKPLARKYGNRQVRIALRKLGRTPASKVRSECIAITRSNIQRSTFAIAYGLN